MCISGWTCGFSPPVSSSAAVVSGSPSTVTYSPRTAVSGSGGSPLKVIRVPAGSVATAGAGGTQVSTILQSQMWPFYSDCFGRFGKKFDITILIHICMENQPGSVMATKFSFDVNSANLKINYLDKAKLLCSEWTPQSNY